VLRLKSQNRAHFSCAFIASSQFLGATLSIVSPNPESGLNMEVAVKEVSAEKVVNTRDPAIADDGKVRMGTMSPTFPPARAHPRPLADSGRLRMGTMSPTFPPPRTR